MAIEKLVQAMSRVVRRRAVVFQPVTKQYRSGLELRVIETMIRAGINDEIDWRPVVTPAGNFIGAVRRRRPIVEVPNEDERGHPGARHCLPTWRVERCRRPESRVALRRDELVKRMGLRDGERNPSACREADRRHTLSIDERLASQEVESAVSIRPALDEGCKRGRCAGVFYATRCVAVDEQDDIAPRDKFIYQLLSCRLMH